MLAFLEAHLLRPHTTKDAAAGEFSTVHVHMMSHNAIASARFYERMFGATVVKSEGANGLPRANISMGGMSYLISQVSSDVPAMMNLDREWMQRALTNYLENAIKYADDGAIMFNVYSSGDCVCFEVIDQGPGIPRQALPRLFDRFYRVDMRAKADGSGLGLAIVKSVAEAHGGQAYVESEEGKGSTFGISLPYQTEDTPGVASQDTSSTSEDAS